MRETYPEAVLAYVEQAYAAYLNGSDDGTGRFDDITFTEGSWQSMAQLNDSTACSIELIYDRVYRVTWHGVAQMQFPVSYDRLLDGERSQIEQALIERLQASHAVPRRATPAYDSAVMSRKDGLVVLEGEAYRIPEVSNNAYFIETVDTLSLLLDSLVEQTTLSLVCSADRPAQSIANIFMCGTERSMPVVITIPRHDYGEQTVRDRCKTPLKICLYRRKFVPLWYESQAKRK